MDDMDDAEIRLAVRVILYPLRGLRATLNLAVLIMHSVLLGALSANNAPVRLRVDVVVVEALLAVATAFSCVDGLCLLRLLSLPSDTFVMAAHIYIATVYEGGRRSCTGYGDTLLGEAAGRGHWLPSVGDACRMQTANFALAVTVAVLSLLFIASEVVLIIVWPPKSKTSLLF